MAGTESPERSKGQGEGRSSVALEHAENFAQLGGEAGKLFARSGVQDTQVDGPVTVDNPVSQPYWLLPGDTRKSRFDFVGRPTGSFTEDGEVPQERVAPLPVSFKLSYGDAVDQLLR